MKKRVSILLNISLGLAICYYELFFIGYFTQKPLFWEILNVDISMMSELEPSYSPLIIGFSLISAAGLAIFNILLRKNSSPGLCIGAEVFTVTAFAADRLVKVIASDMKTIMLGRTAGADGVVVGGLHAKSVAYLDMLLITFFVVSLGLMVCACCIMQCERRTEAVKTEAAVKTAIQ